jgi:hypothetical protein
LGCKYSYNDKRLLQVYFFVHDHLRNMWKFEQPVRVPKPERFREWLYSYSRDRVSAVFGVRLIWRLRMQIEETTSFLQVSTNAEPRSNCTRSPNRSPAVPVLQVKEKQFLPKYPLRSLTDGSVSIGTSREMRSTSLPLNSPFAV